MAKVCERINLSVTKDPRCHVFPGGSETSKIDKN